MRLSTHRLALAVFASCITFYFLYNLDIPLGLPPPFNRGQESPVGYEGPEDTSLARPPSGLRPETDSSSNSVGGGVNVDLDQHEEPDLDYVTRVKRFWKPWARIIYDSRPQIRAIQLRGSASEVSVHEGFAQKFRDPPAQYVSISEEDVASLRESHRKMRDALHAHNASAMNEGLFKGSGIVTVAGGEYFGPAIVGIRMLRQLGSTLPVEAFLANEGEYEKDICEGVLPKLGAKCMVLTDFVAPSRTHLGDKEEIYEETRFDVTHYQLKSLAILFSSFQHVLYLDSDSIPLVDPREFFEQEPYIGTGLIGWPDFWIGTEAPIFYTIADMAGGMPKDLPVTSTEAGQLLVDKNRHLPTLLLAAYYNVWGPDWYYPLLSQGALGQGDKNTFETAAIVLGNPWYRVKRPVRSVGRTTGGRFKGSGMVQYDPRQDFEKSSGNANFTVKPAFLHANTPKMNSGHLVDEGDLQDESTGSHIRLWGSEKEQIDIFGEDLEKKTWMVVRDVGCELAKVIREWKSRWRVCTHLQDHWKETFEKS